MSVLFVCLLVCIAVLSALQRVLLVPQVWRGAFLMADFILSHRDLFQGCTVLELGAGTGVTSIVMATVAKRVYCTGTGACDALCVVCNIRRHDCEGAFIIAHVGWVRIQSRMQRYLN